MNTFDEGALERLVNIASNALEQEDRFLAGCISMNPALYSTDHGGGLLQMDNERYFQFTIVRALMSSFPLRVGFERDSYDLVLYTSADSPHQEYVAVGEIKRWMSPNGTKELEAIRRDLAKLASSRCAAFLLIITAGPEGAIKNHLKWLVNDLSLPKNGKVCAFRSVGREQSPVEIAVAGYLLET